jgi:hypothetical protein
VDWLKQMYAKLTVRLKGEADAGSSMVHGIRGLRGWNHTLFCDDLTLFAQTEAGMQTLLEAVSVFEDWSGLPVKLKKCCVMRIGGQYSEGR